MIVVLEGPDGAGKTYLAGVIERLARQRRLGTAITHEGPPPEGNLLQYYINQLHRGRDRKNVVQIADRHHVGELVYSTTRRNRCRMSLAEALDVNDAIYKAGGKIIFLVPPLNVLVKRLELRGEDWPYLEQERDRFLFLGEHMAADAPGNVRVVDYELDELSTGAVAHWALR